MRYILLALLMMTNIACGENRQDNSTTSDPSSSYYMPIESAQHEGTWLQWPHPYQYGAQYAQWLEPMWIAMTKELINVGKVHIIAYNEKIKTDIIERLKANQIGLDNIDFYLFKTNGVWVRDNGPIFVYNKENSLLSVEGWGFNGWGDKFEYNYDEQIPSEVAKQLDLPYINLQSEMIIEGGAYEFNASGTILLTQSSVLNKNRNPGMSMKRAEELLSNYLGVSNFIWLEGGDVDITDMHVDGFARFSPDGNSIITMSENDLYYWELSRDDIKKLYNAQNANGEKFSYIELPLTQNNVTTTYGKNLGIKGSYVNYYITNGLVLVPIYNDPNDELALQIIKGIYTDRKVVGILAQNIYAEGGMIHCVTQQQPVSSPQK